MNSDRNVVAVIGVGGMGAAIADRLSAGAHVLLADFNEDSLDEVAAKLRADGVLVSTQKVDVSSPDSVRSLARDAAELGRVWQVVWTAGLSPTQASADMILKVDLAGVAYGLDEFGAVIAPGGSGIVIASMAGTFTGDQLPPEAAIELANTPSGELLSLPLLAAPALRDPGAAYGLAKRANQLRVRAASLAWGARGARVNSISPGVISTPMGQQELAGESGASMRAMIDASGTGRIGSPVDIVNAAAFLLGPDASFITGTDLLVDGGVVAAVSVGALRLSRP